LTIEANHVKQNQNYSLAELKSKFAALSYQLVLNVAENGRKKNLILLLKQPMDIGAVYCAK